MDLGPRVIFVLSYLCYTQGYLSWWYAVEIETTSQQTLSSFSDWDLQPGETERKAGGENNASFQTAILEEVTKESVEYPMLNSTEREITLFSLIMLPVEGNITTTLHGVEQNVPMTPTTETEKTATKKTTIHPETTVKPTTVYLTSSLPSVTTFQLTTPRCSYSCLDSEVQLDLSHTKLREVEHNIVDMVCKVKYLQSRIIDENEFSVEWSFWSTDGSNCTFTETGGPSLCNVNSSINSTMQNTTHKSVLTLRNLQTHHTGMYACKVTVFCCNGSEIIALQQEDIVTLNVYIKPDYFTDFIVICAIIFVLDFFLLIFFVLMLRRERAESRKVVDKLTYKPVKVLHLPVLTSEGEKEKKDVKADSVSSSDESFDFDQD